MGDVVSRERRMLWLSLLAATSSSQPRGSPGAAAGPTNQGEKPRCPKGRCWAVASRDAVSVEETDACVSAVYVNLIVSECEVWGWLPQQAACMCVCVCVWMNVYVHVSFYIPLFLMQFNLPSTQMICYPPLAPLPSSPHTLTHTVLRYLSES